MKSNEKWWILCGLAIHFVFLSCIGDKMIIAQEADATAVESMSVINLFERVEKALKKGELDSPLDLKGRLLEQHLLELIRRSGLYVERRLKNLLLERQNELKRFEADFPNAFEKRESLEDNLALLTTLRRVQKRPDPLVIDVKLARDYQKWAHNAVGYWFIQV